MNVVPFTLEAWAGFGQCRGLVRDEGKELVFEFQVMDSVFGVLKQPLKRVRAPIRDLLSVTLEKPLPGVNWFGVTIVVQSTRWETLRDLPRGGQGRVELHVAGKDAAWAEKFVAGLYEPDPNA